MSVAIVPAGAEGAAADPLTAGITKLTHELSVLPLRGEKLDFAGSFGPSAFTLTNYTFWLIVAVALLALFFIVASRRVSLVPRGIGNLAEAGVQFVRDNICVDVMGPEGRTYFPFIGTVFFFVLFNNLLGNIPPALPGTGTVGTTFLWGVVVFLVYNGIGIRKNGAWGYLKSFIPSGTSCVRSRSASGSSPTCTRATSCSASSRSSARWCSSTSPRPVCSSCRCRSSCRSFCAPSSCSSRSCRPTSSRS
jgi:hypothetical protein